MRKPFLFLAAILVFVGLAGLVRLSSLEAAVPAPEPQGRTLLFLPPGNMVTGGGNICVRNFGSGPVQVQFKLNGTPVGTEGLGPGQKTCARVPPGLLGQKVSICVEGPGVEESRCWTVR